MGLNSCKAAQRGGSEREGAGEVCREDKEEARGWAGGGGGGRNAGGVDQGDTDQRRIPNRDRQRFDSRAGREADLKSSSGLDS